MSNKPFIAKNLCHVAAVLNDLVLQGHVAVTRRRVIESAANAGNAVAPEESHLMDPIRRHNRTEGVTWQEKVQVPEIIHICFDDEGARRINTALAAESGENILKTARPFGAVKDHYDWGKFTHVITFANMALHISSNEGNNARLKPNALLKAILNDPEVAEIGLLQSGAEHRAESGKKSNGKRGRDGP